MINVLRDPNIQYGDNFANAVTIQNNNITVEYVLRCAWLTGEEAFELMTGVSVELAAIDAHRWHEREKGFIAETFNSEATKELKRKWKLWEECCALPNSDEYMEENSYWDDERNCLVYIAPNGEEFDMESPSTNSLRIDPLDLLTKAKKAGIYLPKVARETLREIKKRKKINKEKK